MGEDVVAVLVKAKERVAAGWRQGGATFHDVDNGGSVCAGQAMGIACQLRADQWAAAERFFLRAINREHKASIARWNDMPGRTQADVLDAFDAAIRLAKDSA